ncbi:hypothetical protein CYPRO_2829 [Cyclonatronum proteinivorum]|uniref:Transmembrane transcriptional regulator (Anti-sigma factor RsiW) n=1 Tax=Cyclonatronum proteinivorum TaxID=1457365 RepID=A0A345UNL5_9BACT|nr:hypothetical protein [Cyclonatronum proteinivorum]AXJ02067.1 hypothetical protein CYPRO_2829 [Cyclonatronum proteinivorum]
MMDKKNLSELITAFADGELTADEKKKLKDLAERDPAIEKAITIEKRTKQTVQLHYKKEPAPQHLHQIIREKLQAEQAEVEAYLRENSQAETKPNKYWMPLAAILILSAFLFLVQQYSPFGTSSEAAHSFEELTYLHFTNHAGAFVQPEGRPNSVSEAQTYLRDAYGCNITVPEIFAAELVGVFYTDFFEGFHTPLLKYHTVEGDPIFIFASELHNLDTHPGLNPLDEAFGNIHAHNDVFIKKFNGHDVVSWKWDDVWYAGIFEHDGRILAAMLPH